jgi:hypothetical protein
MENQGLLVRLLISGVMKDNNRQDFGGKKIIGIKYKSFLTLLSSKNENHENILACTDIISFTRRPRDL